MRTTEGGDGARGRDREGGARRRKRERLLSLSLPKNYIHFLMILASLNSKKSSKNSKKISTSS